MSPSKASPSSRKVSQRQLIRPSADIPWSLDVVSAVPKEVVDKLSAAVTSAICEGWACIGMRDGNFQVWQHKTISLSEALEPPKDVMKIYFPDMAVKNENDDNALVALAPALNRDSVHLYAANPRTGQLVVRKVSRMDLRSKMPLPRSYSAKASVPLTTLEDGTKETLTVLVASSNGLVALGTSMGAIYWVTHTSVPVGLHVQKATVPQGYFSLNRFFSSGAGEGTSHRIAQIVPLTSTEFLSMDEVGTLLRWKATLTVASSHHATFEAKTLGTLSIPNSSSSNLTVLRTILSSLNGDSIHCIVRARENGVEESKLFWLEVSIPDGEETQDTLTNRRVQWLSRFPDAEQVRILGMASSDNGDAYAAFSTSTNHPIVAMVLLDNDSDDEDEPDHPISLHEVDLPSTQVPSLLPSMFFKDRVTHGCFTVATSGIGLRVRFLSPHFNQGHQLMLSTPAAKRSRLSMSTPAPTMMVPTLVSHLRSVYWQSYEDPDDDAASAILRRLPPSFSQASPVDLENAILTFAVELQRKGDVRSSLQNPLEWHKALIKLLQDCGFYRSLQAPARWKLLSIGQELTVVLHLPRLVALTIRRSGTDNWEEELLARLKPHSICDWLLQVQSQEIRGGWQHAAVWNEWLCASLENATKYKEEMANHFYDITDDVGRSPGGNLGDGQALGGMSWMSTPALQTVLMKQMEYWKQDPSTAELKHVETVVRAALLSYAESYHHQTNEQESGDDKKQLYCRVKETAISLLRMVNEGNDELAFELSTQYNFFEGLCKISIDHEKKMDAKLYSLDPLFSNLEGVKDIDSGFTFAQYVLQWHTDKGLYGHAINYGRHSKKDLDLLTKLDERLHPYRWIPSIRDSCFTNATESFLDNCESKNATLGDNIWSLSMAKLCNKLEAARIAGDAAQRQKGIEHKLELVNAQQFLFEMGNGGDETIQESLCWPPDKLIALAMDKLDDASTKEVHVRLCLTGLAICAAMESATGDSSVSSFIEHAADVWAKTIQLDSKMWLEWIRTETDLSNVGLRSTALDSTVFGALVCECRKEESLRSVTYYGQPQMESMVLQKLGQGDQKALGRLLRYVAATPIQGRSLVVSSF